MVKIKILPHPIICPDGLEIQAKAGISICKNLLNNRVQIEHACDMVGACTTCHVLVKAGYESLSPLEEDEEDMLDKAWGLTSLSRLSCQAKISNQNLIIEIPRYSVNHASENSPF